MSPVGSQLFADGTYTLPEFAAQAVSSAAPMQRLASSFTSFRLDVFIDQACHKAVGDVCMFARYLTTTDFATPRCRENMVDMSTITF